MPDSVRTKKALAVAMKELMSARPFSEITVTDICALCGLTRKSLYYHFSDKYELVNWIFHSELIVPLEGRPHADYWELIREVADYLYENRQFYSHAFQIPDDSFWFYFSQYLRPSLLATMHNHFDDSVFFSVEQKRAAWADFLADAWVYSLKKWILYAPQLTPEKYVDLFRVESWVENPPGYYTGKDRKP